MTPRDFHESAPWFEYVRTDGGVPSAERSAIDVAVLDMNHSWPNVGHDSIVTEIREVADDLRPALAARGLRVRVLSFDVRRKLMIPESPNGRLRLYIGTGGPGHLDPRQNDGEKEWSQGIRETDAWEAPLFRLFDDILEHPDAALIGICHSFGLMCRWSAIAHPELRGEKSSGMPVNVLSAAAGDHPWFSRFAGELPDGQTFRVVDNRLFDLVLDGGNVTPLAFERPDSGVLTIAELARRDGMPRVLGMNHHPEIIDREHLLAVLQHKRERGEVSERWFQERSHTLENEMRGEAEQQSRLTSHYTFLGPLQWHLERLIAER